MRNTLLMRCVILLVLPVIFSVFAAAQVPLNGSVSDGSGGPLVSGTVYHSGGFQVPLGQTLTIPAGTIIKFTTGGAQITVSGTLLVQGSTANPVIFTGLADDSAGGDTNGNGPSSASSAAWRGLLLDATGSAQISGMDIRYGGNSFVAAVRLSSAAGNTLTDCVFRDHAGAGLDYQTDGVATVTGCSFTSCARPVVNSRFDQLAGFTSNTASGNASHNSVEVSSAPITGNVSVPANSVMGGAHLLNGSGTINVGASMTVDAGVVFKINSSSYQFNVDGALICNGTGGSPVVFTHPADDDHGGDTNNNGPSAGSYAYWRGFLFSDTADASSLQNTIVRFTGSSFVSAIRLMDADVNLQSCIITECSGDGVDLMSSSSMPTISNCDIHLVRSPIVNVSFASLANFSNNTASQCTSSNVILCPDTNVTSSLSLGTTNLINGVLGTQASWTIDAGADLSLGAGVIVKTTVGSGMITIDGVLNCQGSAGNEVVFTTFADDAFGGDSNANGASSGTVNTWRGLLFNSTSSASVLTSMRIRYCGSSFVPAMRINGSDLTFTNSVIENSGSLALSLMSTPASPTVSGCSFNNCGTAVGEIFLESLAGFSGNSATGNSLRNTIRVVGSTISSTVTVLASNLINGDTEIVGSTTIAAGAELILGPGVVFKYSSGAAFLATSGILTCNGTAANPVVLTVIADDDHGSDTNNNGPSNGSPAAWRGLRFDPGSDASELTHTIIRYSGSSFTPGVLIDGASITMTDCTIRDGIAAGMNFTSSNAKPFIRNCAFNLNNRAIDGLRWGNLENFVDNTATGNTSYDNPIVDRSEIEGDVRVHARAMMNGAFVCEANPTIEAMESLTFERGVVVKVASNREISANLGSLNVLGTGVEPVVFTVLADDSYAGDTNKNGPSSGAKAAWRGLNFPGTEPSTVEYAVVRYSGSSFVPAIRVATSATSLKSVSVEHNLSDGFEINDMGAPMDNLVAFDCGLGFDFTGSSANQDLRFATATACTTGISLGGSHTGLLQGCNIWGNTTNYVGATAANLFDSNGSAALAGMNGNINADPMFVDASLAAGDLRLQISSPCIDAANFGLGMIVAADHLESSRLNDHDLDGNVGCDMGAFEFSNYSMVVTGQPILGQTMSFTLTGLPGIGQICSALLDGTSYMSPFGMVLVGTPATVLLEDLVYEGYGYPITVPNMPQIVGTEFGVQMGGAALGDTTTGNITNLYRGVVRD